MIENQINTDKNNHAGNALGVSAWLFISENLNSVNR